MSGGVAGHLRVLVVEADPEDREDVVRELASSPGRLRAVYVDTLEAALAHLAAQPYDVVVLDLELPDSASSGPSIVRRVVRSAGFAEVVVLARAVAEDTLRGCHEAGAASVLLHRPGSTPAPPSLGQHLHGLALRSRARRRREAERERELAALRERVEAVIAPASLGDRVRALPDRQLGALLVAVAGVAAAAVGAGGELAAALAAWLAR